MVTHMTFLLAAFVNPALAMSGAGLAGLPILIHLLNRRRFRRIVWAAMEWLLAAQRKNARRIRIEQLLLLAIRCLIMLLIGFALARPILGAMGLFGQNRTVRLIVLDDSYSMNYDGNPATSQFAKAKAAAIQMVDLLDRDDAVAVVLSGSPARKLIGEPSYEHKTVKDAIAALRPTARGTDLGGALKLARTILNAKDVVGSKQILFIGDRSKSAWQPQPSGEGASAGEKIAPALTDLGKMSTLTFIDVGGDNPPNLAMTDLTARHEIVGIEHQVHVVATIRNFTGQRQRNLRVKFTRDPLRAAAEERKKDQIVNVPDIPDGGTATVEQLMEMADAGFHSVRAVLMGPKDEIVPEDKVAEDNERFVSIRLRRWVQVRLIDGEPPLAGRREVESEVFGLKLAFAPTVKPGLEEAEELKSYTLQPDVQPGLRPAPGWLNDVDLLVLANVDLSATAQNQQIADDLTAFVQRGGGLMIFLGKQIETARSIEAYNQLLYRDGKGVLPARLITAVGSNERVNGEQFVMEDPNHPVLADFKAKQDSLKSPQFYRHIKAMLPAKTGARVLLKYDRSGDPALVVSHFGEGRVALITSSADGDWNNFYSKVDYLPLFNQLAYQLSPAADTTRNLMVGGALAEPLTADQARINAELALELPGTTVRPAMVDKPPVRSLPREEREERKVSAVEDQTGSTTADRRQFLVRADNLDLPGLYVLKVADVPTGKDAAGRPLPADRTEQQSRFIYAVNTPAATEGELKTVAPDAIREMLGSGAKILTPEDLVEARSDLLGGTEVSRTLLYIVLALCMLETVLAQRFGHFRE